jgi:ribonucleoside-diphosphate reductase alpha chain
VDPRDTGFDALGKGVEEGKPSSSATSRVVSKGLVRGKNLTAVAGGAVSGGSSGGGETMAGGSAPRAQASNVTALRSLAAQELTQGAVALKAEVDAEPGNGHRAALLEQRAAAKAKGYEGEACPECHNFTMVRNGTCLKCDTCGSTTGCS